MRLYNSFSQTDPSQILDSPLELGLFNYCFKKYALEGGGHQNIYPFTVWIWQTSQISQGPNYITYIYTQQHYNVIPNPANTTTVRFDYPACRPSDDQETLTLILVNKATSSDTWVVRQTTTAQHAQRCQRGANFANHNDISYRIYLLYRHLCMFLS